MEQQSGNNFDALFQKAAEGYPLKTDNSNWKIVAAKLRKVTASSPANKSRKWQYAAILLLLLSAGGFIYFSNKSINGDNQSAGNQSKIISDKSAKLSRSNNQSKETLTAKNFQDKVVKNIANSNLLKQSTINSKSNSSSALNTKTYKQQNFAADNKIKSREITGVKEVPGQSKTPASANSLSQTFLNNNNIETKTVDETNNKNVTQLSKENAENIETKNNKPDDFKSTESQHVKLAPQPKLLYGELFFAPDFSTVKLQNVNAPGYNIGIAIGYRISKRFSAELGLERLHTDFYSNAKYLDKSHLKLKPNTTVQFVNGKSKLTEVPFDVKYNLSKKNDHFFVTMGTTIARITHTEKYNYRVIKDGTQHEASKHFGALTGTEFFSDLNVSAGYQTKLSGSFSLKAEPYYQIPLKGLGVGNLPVTNFGVSIGIIKDLK